MNVFAQTNFTISPEKPKPGDLITITYEPAGDLANPLVAGRAFGSASEFRPRQGGPTAANGPDRKQCAAAASGGQADR